MDAWQQEKFKFSKNYSVRLLMYQCVPSSGKSLQLHLFLTTCNLTTYYNIFLITVIVVPRYYQRELSNLPLIGRLRAQTQQ